VDGYRSGFACFVGRPNAGKSTLTNALTGAKVTITSSRPQTTRHVVRGIVHRPDAQLVLVDTPGLHKPRTLLGQRLNDLVRETYAGVDLVCLCIPADEKVGPGDRFIAAELAELKTPVLAVVTKTDKASKQQVGEQLLAVSQLADWAEVIPVSAVSDFQVQLLADLLVARLPEGPALYPDGELTDEPEQVLVAELIREAALEGVRDELPHSMAVTVEEMGLREGRSPRCTSNATARRRSCWASRAPGFATSAPRPVSRSSGCWAPACTSTCTSPSPRTGSATPSSYASSASSQVAPPTAPAAQASPGGSPARRADEGPPAPVAARRPRPLRR
jgi:GTP-binding protein Era